MGGAVLLFISSTNLRFFSVVRNNQSYCFIVLSASSLGGLLRLLYNMRFCFWLLRITISALLTVYIPIMGYSSVHIKVLD